MTVLADTKQCITCISQDMPSVRTAVDQMHQAIPAISNEVVLIGSNVKDVKEELQHMRGHIQRSKEQLDHLPIISERIDTLPSRVASSIMLQLESHNHERHQFQSSGPGAAEIVDKIDALVCVYSLIKSMYSTFLGTRDKAVTTVLHK
jgi:hypothetical protein